MIGKHNPRAASFTMIHAGVLLLALVAAPLLSAQIETAVCHDSHAVEPMLEDLESRGHLPETMLADTAYGSDDNITAAEERGTDLVSPTTGVPAQDDANVDHLGPDDIKTDAGGHIIACPAGHQPVDSFIDDQGRAHAVMDGPTCAACAFQKECPMRRHVIKNQGPHNTNGPRPVLTVDPKQQRRHDRRRRERTEAFRQQYRKRAGHESSFSGMKRRCGLGRLRTRGSPGVTLSALLKITGWNLLRAAASTRMRAKIGKQVRRALQGASAAVLADLRRRFGLQGSRRPDFRHCWPSRAPIPAANAIAA